MIEWDKSAELNECTIKELKAHFIRFNKSHKQVVTICDKCGKEWVSQHRGRVHGKCNLCANQSPERRNRISDSHTGKKLSDEHKRNISSGQTGTKRAPYTEEHKRKISNGLKGREVSIKTRKLLSISSTGNKSNLGKTRSEEANRKSSATKQNLSYDQWEKYACDKRYCPKFTELCRESNREKYGRQCFLCGLLESENTTSVGKHIKLAVHHVDMNKEQGCDDHEWKLVPLCLHHHGGAHSDLVMNRIIYLLEHVWSKV